MTTLKMNSMIATAAPDFDVRVLDVPRARAAGIEIFCVTFDFAMSLEHPAFAVLSDDERAKAARFLRHEDALRHAGTRVVLRYLLAERTGVKPDALHFEPDAAGRPRIVSLRNPLSNTPGAPDVCLDFNVSHSGRHALIAIAARGRVGVDIEAARNGIDWQRLTPTVFAPRDNAYVSALPVSLRADAFYAVWTAKEALLKALGVGIGDGMTWFSVLGDGDGQHEPSVALSDDHARNGNAILQLDAQWLQISAGYCACVAWSGDGVLPDL
ncbi:4'-phosphopantetheinyl transferase family protein [Paraburkholderia sp. ZP32-5]|uniref:4'-phosphopantetheinyl transferase family protein n=1 Tax=Paraburkholderia sp. ZP32-5 TaxID=2883245 RepID=UPI001F290A99|nr:4'-phosphopantetheinyl transferase superfamily protein [Paraburkholderia sp. ZP32-5]